MGNPTGQLLTSSHLTWRRLQTRLFPSVTCTRDVTIHSTGESNHGPSGSGTQSPATGLSWLADATRGICHSVGDLCTIKGDSSAAGGRGGGYPETQGGRLESLGVIKSRRGSSGQFSVRWSNASSLGAIPESPAPSGGKPGNLETSFRAFRYNRHLRGSTEGR